MSQYHELTEKIWKDEASKKDVDKGIRAYLEEKAGELARANKRHHFFKEDIESILGLSQPKTLEVKFREWTGKECKLDDWFFEGLADIAKDHYKEQGVIE